MINRKFQIESFSMSKPYVIATFTKEQIQPIIEAVKNIKLNNLQEYNHQLSGNIEHEYDLIDNLDLVNYITTMYKPIIKYHNKQTEYITNMTVNSDDTNIVLNRLWVNFQKKNEFNPIHTHSGLISFVIWLEIPYTIEEEKKNISGINSSMNVPGHFYFAYTCPVNISGITVDTLPIDKTWEGKTALFPSSLSHGVYPFYSSDKYRISVSGNFMFDTSLQNQHYSNN